ncbi:MAG: DUF2730 family protein [Gemmobacter sp.]|nr:DUF2730 family protein [Gemmobacter sp.]
MTFAFDTTITLGVIVTVVLAVIAWIRTRWGGLDTRLSDQSARLDRHDSRISATEQTVQTLPGKDDIHDLRLALSDLKGDMKEVRAGQAAAAEAFRGQAIVVARVEQYLLEKSGK